MSRRLVAVFLGLSSLLASPALHPETSLAGPTPTPQPTINGIVYESFSGVLRGATVTLNPLGLTTTTSLDDGSFHFFNVPDGSYTLTVSPGCTPFGCYKPEPVTVAGAKVFVSIFPQAFTPTPLPVGGIAEQPRILESGQRGESGGERLSPLVAGGLGALALAALVGARAAAALWYGRRRAPR